MTHISIRSASIVCGVFKNACVCLLRMGQICILDIWWLYSSFPAVIWTKANYLYEIANILVPGYGILECGKQGVWKTRFSSGEKQRVLSEKQGGTIISPNYEFSSLNWDVEFFLFQIALKINSTSHFICETHFSNISCERNSFNHRELSAAVFFGTRCLFFFLFFKILK